MEELGIPMDVEEAATLFSMVDENGYGIMEEVPAFPVMRLTMEGGPNPRTVHRRPKQSC